jgi:hypothetical protein
MQCRHREPAATSAIEWTNHLTALRLNGHRRNINIYISDIVPLVDKKWIAQQAVLAGESREIVAVGIAIAPRWHPGGK